MKRFPLMRLLVLFLGILIIAVSIGYFEIYDLNRDIQKTWQMFEESMKWEGDIVPSLIATVATGSDREKILIDSISKAWRNLMRFKSREHIIEAYKVMHSAAQHLLDLGMQKKELSDDPEFRILVNDLKNARSTVDSLAIQYNFAVVRYNRLISTFPFNLIARATGFTEEPKLSLEGSNGGHKSKG